jgi:hypothetical protein
MFIAAEAGASDATSTASGGSMATYRLDIKTVGPRETCSEIIQCPLLPMGVLKLI